MRVPFCQYIPKSIIMRKYCGIKKLLDLEERISAMLTYPALIKLLPYILTHSGPVCIGTQFTTLYLFFS